MSASVAIPLPSVGCRYKHTQTKFSFSVFRFSFLSSHHLPQCGVEPRFRYGPSSLPSSQPLLTAQTSSNTTSTQTRMPSLPSSTLQTAGRPTPRLLTIGVLSPSTPSSWTSLQTVIPPTTTFSAPPMRMTGERPSSATAATSRVSLQSSTISPAWASRSSSSPVLPSSTCYGRPTVSPRPCFPGPPFSQSPRLLPHRHVRPRSPLGNHRRMA